MKDEGTLEMRFLRHAESIGPMCHHIFIPGPSPAFRSGRCQGIGQAGKNMPCPSSAMSSGRLFLSGLLASIARLRFTGSLILKPFRDRAQ
jgi:hypothetical protein